jgi:cobalamin biosynthesis protein CobD/CbiB
MNYYEGKVYRQAFLNPTGRVCEAKDILRGISLLWMAAMVLGATLLILAMVAH